MADYEDKKKSGLAALLVGPIKAKAKEGTADKSKDFEAAAGDLFDAVKAGDKSAFSEALEACLSCKH